jgi:pimeloyl-ACP methyl ester carboxylesterase
MQAETDDPHRKNIEDVRSFIDQVIDYLDVPRVVLIGHSLGVGMVRGYLFGLDSDGTFKPSLLRVDKVAGLVGLAGGNYGLGTGAGTTSEFITGGPFEVSTHKFPGTEIWDDTPFGAKQMPATNTQGRTPLPDGRTYNDGTFGFSGTALDVEDNDPRRIYYAGLTANLDFCDLKLRNTSYLQGADVNQGWDLGGKWDPTGFNGHREIIQNQQVFEEGILPILEKCNAAKNDLNP